jgi:hypothetical protein
MVMKFRTGDEIKKELDEIVVEQNKDRIVNLIERFSNEYLMKGWTKTPFRPEKNIFETFQTLPNDYDDQVNLGRNSEPIDLDDYLEEIMEFFVRNFYWYNKKIFSLIKNELLPEIEKIIETEDDCESQDSEVIAKNIIAKQMWVIIIRKNKTAQRALSLLGEYRDQMVYKGQRKGMSKKDSVEKDLIKYCSKIKYDQFKFA